MSDIIQTPAEGTEQEQVTPQADPEMETPQNPSEDIVDPSIEADPQPEQPSPEPQPQPDYKEKFVHSQRESILNAERVKVKEAQIESLTKQDTPTDEAMRQLYPEWDSLDDYNKRVLTRQETLAMQQTRILKEQEEDRARRKLEDELDAVLDNSDYAPKLKGKEAEFRTFARNPKNRGIAAEVLAKAFLFDADEEVPQPVGDPPPKVKEALPAGSGGPRGPIKPKKISLEEAAVIRKTDYKRYKELLDADAIEELE